MLQHLSADRPCQTAGPALLVHQADHVHARPRPPVQPHVLPRGEQPAHRPVHVVRAALQDAVTYEGFKVLSSQFPNQSLTSWCIVTSSLWRQEGVKKARCATITPTHSDQCKITACRPPPRRRRTDCIVRQRHPKLVIPAGSAIATMPPEPIHARPSHTTSASARRNQSSPRTAPSHSRRSNCPLRQEPHRRRWQLTADGIRPRGRRLHLPRNVSRGGDTLDPVNVRTVPELTTSSKPAYCSANQVPAASSRYPGPVAVDVPA